MITIMKLNHTTHGHSFIQNDHLQQTWQRLIWLSLFKYWLSTLHTIFLYLDCLVQDCSISCVLAMEILQSCTEPSIWSHVNSSPQSAAYMHRSTTSALVLVMDCLPVQRQAITWTNTELLSIGPLQRHFSVILIKRLFFIQKNASENFICEMAAILSRKRQVNQDV